MLKKICRNCAHFPCLRQECDINNETACGIFTSTVEAAIKEIDRKVVEEVK